MSSAECFSTCLFLHVPCETSFWHLLFQRASFCVVVRNMRFEKRWSCWWGSRRSWQARIHCASVITQALSLSWVLPALQTAGSPDPRGPPPPATCPCTWALLLRYLPLPQHLDKHCEHHGSGDSILMPVNLCPDSWPLACSRGTPSAYEH